MNKEWYRGVLTVENTGQSRLFVAQTFAASADEAIENIQKQLPGDWQVPMMSVGAVLEPLRPNELGWQPKDAPNAKTTSDCQAR